MRRYAITFPVGGWKNYKYHFYEPFGPVLLCQKHEQQVRKARVTDVKSVITKLILVQLFGQRMSILPCFAFTDCRNLYEAVRITKLVDDSWIITDIAMIKDALSSGDITELRHCRSERMLANYLTKNGACGNDGKHEKRSL